MCRRALPGDRQIGAAPDRRTMGRANVRLVTGNGGSRPLRRSSRPLAEAYRTALLGLDGVVCRGAVALPNAVPALAWAGRLGLRPVYVTGHDSRGPGELGGLLQALGLAVGDQEPVVPVPAALNGGGPYLLVGDSLHTDIRDANRRGLDSLLVLTGDATVGALLMARPELRPTYLSADLRGLLDPHPRVQAMGATFRCGSWSARVEGHAVALSTVPRQPADPIDGVRAMCRAAWHSADQGIRVCPELSVAAWLRAIRRCAHA
jgi:hypothetical protein